MAGFQVVQSTSPWAEVFGSTLDSFSDVLPEIIQAKRAYDEEEDSAEQLATEYKGLLGEITSNGELMSSLATKSGHENPSELGQEMLDWVNNFDASKSKSKALKGITDHMSYISQLGAEELGQDWMIRYAQTSGDPRAAQEVSRNRENEIATMRNRDLRAQVEDIDRKWNEEGADRAQLLNDARMNPEINNNFGSYIANRQSQLDEDADFARREEEETNRIGLIEQVNKDAGRWENVEETAEKVYTQALDEYGGDVEAAKMAADIRQAAINEDNLQYSRTTGRARTAQGEDILSAEDILKNTEMNNQTLSHFQNQVTELSEDIMELETEKRAAETPEEKATLTRQIANLNKALKISSEAAGLIESHLVPGSGTTGQQASAEVQARENVRGEIPEAIRGAEAAFEEGTSGFGNFLSRILPGGRNAPRDELIKANEELSQYGIVAERSGGGLKFTDSATGRELTADQVEAEIENGSGAEEAESKIGAWLQNSTPIEQSDTPLMAQPFSNEIDPNLL